MESASRLTRSACARLAHLERDDSCEPSARRHLRSEKRPRNWTAYFIDSKVSKRLDAAKLDATSTEKEPVGDMAPGGMHLKKKKQFLPNHTSLKSLPNSTPRRTARVENDGMTNSTPTSNPPIPPKTKVPLTQPQVSRTRPTIGQTNTTSPQTNSTVHQTQSSSPDGQPIGSGQTNATTHSESNVNQIQTNESETSDRATHSAENMEDATYEDDAETDVVPIKTNKRGRTVGRGLKRGLGGSSKKIKINVDPVIGRPRNRQQSAKFSSQIGVVTRDVLPVMRKWKDIDLQTALEPCVDHMQIYMDVNMDKPGVKESVVERLKISSRQQRHRLHKYYSSFPNIEEAKKKLPPSFTTDQQENWNSLCEFFNSAEFKHRSQVNKENRNKIRAPHATGRTAFSVIQHELSAKAGPDGDAIEMYLKTHKNEKGWKTPDGELNWEIMLANQAHYAEEGIEITEREIVTEVLGEANGYIKGLGYGQKPPGKCSSSRHLQQQLDEAHEELRESRSEAANFKIVVETLKTQLNQQGANIDQLMALFQGREKNADKNNADKGSDGTA